ncbi:sulfotransferase domain-containing protein [Fuscovulum ytuae]|uniref:Sulfotransferase domain-containing protein n=1 Tax=Fuscovulum ytuae TaxID=3042299 RepID=A0ABY8Q752_9RHOB|nr:sulfotransferase domain-containing protein [Fuscovulum sp. YMD61]WGV15921.1 sulfotransferase domain-containing protein [Fuscovulum sp. YMD61]
MAKPDHKVQDQYTVSGTGLTGREVIVFSSGRSGSNRILDIADLASETHCRNEPNEYCQSFSPMRNLVSTASQGNAEALIQSMSAAIQCYGIRDRFKTNPKRFLKPFIGVVYRHTCAHRSLREIVLNIKTPEWNIPLEVFRKDWNETVVPVFKISASLATAEQVAATPPEVKIIHNLRKPSAMLQSWWNRYCLEFRGGNLDFLEAEINSHLEKWGKARYASFENKGLTQLERVIRANLFAWRLANEAVYNARKHSSSYIITDYDEVTRDQKSKAEEILSFIGVKREISGPTRPTVVNELFQSTHQQALPNDLLSSAIKDVLTGSTLDQLIND